MTEGQRPTTCPYCGLHDHTGREHMQFVLSLSLGDDPDDRQLADSAQAGER